MSSLKEKCESGKKELAKLRAQRDLVQQIRAEQNPRCELLKKSLDSCKKEVTEKIDALNTISSQVTRSDPLDIERYSFFYSLINRWFLWKSRVLAFVQAFNAIEAPQRFSRRISSARKPSAYNFSR